MAKAPSTNSEVFIQEVNKGQMTFAILGNSPVILHRMSRKGSEELLLPRGRKNAAEKASSLKHEPLAEYRESPYKNVDADALTRLQLLGSMFKGAMKTAALDLPGAKKAQIGRLVYVDEIRVDLYGLPQLLMSITRSSDMNRTPDVRTRAIVAEWACIINVSFIKPIIKEQSVANLLSAAGITAGVGDWRVEKGSGSFGTFRLVSMDDPNFQRIMKIGREQQDEALEAPTCYDDETESLLSWYLAEVPRRGFKVVA